jgi:hypothetical protein
MALQKINWTQVDTENVPSGSTIDLGSISGSLHAVYADNLYISGTSVTALIAAGGTGGTGGLSGTSGSSGTSGVGTSGTSGSSGTGTSGTSGTSGVGTSGTSGSSGTGTAGTSGSSGSSGSSGIAGTSGTSGAGTAITLTDGSTTINNVDKITFSGTTITDSGNGDVIVTITGGVGTNGTSGTSGVGTSGSSGTSGVAGTSGSSGIDGTSGTSGVAGTSGSSGTAGSSGTSGVAGTSGSSGTSGVAGTSGTSGVGTSGSSGSSGTGSSLSVTQSGGSTYSAISGITFSGVTISDQGSGNITVSIAGGTSGTGGSGTSGTSGIAGYEGHLAIWRYSGNTNTALDPGAGYFNLNSAAWGTSTTSITLDNVAYLPNQDFEAYLDGLTIGTILKLVKVGDASTFKLLKIDLVSPLDSGFENYTVSQLSSGGSTPNNNDEFLLIPLGVPGLTGTAGTSGSSGSSGDTIFGLTGSYYATNQNIQITGSVATLMKSPDGATDAKYALAISQSIHANNINVGVPTSNDWGSNLNGSYFNNFNKNTDVSEILRFVAGLLSSSAPDAAPNTRTYSTATKNIVNSTVGSVSTTVPGSVPQSSTNTTITYLNGKGFANTGQPLFSGITVNTNASYGHTFTSVAAGSTIISSSVNAQLFGLGQLSSGTPTNFRVSGSFNFKFKDNSLKTDTATSSSNHLVTQTGAGNTGGVYLAKINTANSAVIPAAYQDGYYDSTFSPTIYNGGATSISGSGYYHITSSISISSGSATTYTTPVTSSTEVFYAPLSTIATNVPAQTPTFSGVSVNGITAVSRSLSGAPYLSSATYTISGSVLGLFNPLFYAGTGIATITDSDGLVTESGGILTVSTAGGTIGTANAVYDSTGVTARSTGTVPYETDIVKVYTTSSFAPGTSDENINQTGLGTTSFSLYINGLNKAGTTTTNTSTVSYHTAGAFGQPSASGSLAYYGRTQGADTATNGGASNSEPFLGENYRIQLSDNILSFTGTAWDTAFGLYNLGAKDLQVKPGYLVKPGGTYGYWLTNPSAASDYKYYIRKVTTNAGVKNTMTLNMGATLVNWDATTSNSVSCLVLFESTKSGLYTPPRFFDPSNDLTNLGTITANTDGTNPFGSSIQVYQSSTSTVSSTTYTIPLISANGMTLNATYTNIYVIVRYKGDPTPITSITTTFS